jgi:hypothetical protein
MASEHYRVSPRYWSGSRRSWNDREKLLGLYLLTCPHRTTEGLYHLPKGYIATDLGWTTRQVDEALATLLADGFLRYDDEAEVVLLPKALKRQRPTTVKQIAGAVRSLERVPDSPLWEPFMRACDEFAPPLSEAIRMGIASHSNGHANGHSDAHADGLSDASAGSLARVHAHSSSSSSSSTSTPPSPPEGGRQRDSELFFREMQAWAAGHFPSVPWTKVQALANTLRENGVEPTADAMRSYASTRPAWSLDGGEAADAA